MAHPGRPATKLQITDAERAEKERKRAIIQAAIERSRQQKEAAQAAPTEKKP